MPKGKKKKGPVFKKKVTTGWMVRYEWSGGVKWWVDAEYHQDRSSADGDVDHYKSLPNYYRSVRLIRLVKWV